jgi:hypothetical protein
MGTIDLKKHFNAVARLERSILERRKEAGKAPPSAAVARDIARLTALAGQTQFSRAYNETQDRILDAFKRRLPGIRGFDRAVARWPDMSLRAQKRFLTRIAGLLADCQAEAVVPVAVHAAPIRWRGDKHFPYDGLSTNDLWEEDEAEAETLIEISSKGPNRASIAEAVDIVVHEQTHIFEGWLARAYNLKIIRRSHPLYKDARLASYALAKGYISASIDKAYRAQCVEQDAYRTGRIASVFMKAALARADRAGRVSRAAASKMPPAPANDARRGPRIAV